MLCFKLHVIFILQQLQFATFDLKKFYDFYYYLDESQKVRLKNDLF